MKFGPTHELRQVNGHVCGYNTCFVPTHMHKMRIKKKGDRKESKINNSKNKTGKAKHRAFPKVGDDYKNKGDAQVTCSMYMQQLRDLCQR
jgi:hypothetical protein